jgi:TatD DNase family protein
MMNENRMTPLKSPIWTYEIRNSLYLNITNRCTLACTFCPKFKDFTVKGYNLKTDREPTAKEILKMISSPLKYEEIVFCGFGEPTLRLDVLLEIAQNLRKKGCQRIRLNTDGLGNLIHCRNICPELSQGIDALSVSLNAPDAKTHARICPNPYGQGAYEEVKDFILKAKKDFMDITASIVGLPNLNVESCRKVAQNLGVKFRLRLHNQVG